MGNKCKTIGPCSADRTILDILSKWDEFRKTNWIEEIEYPELTLQQTQYLLAL